MPGKNPRKLRKAWCRFGSLAFFGLLNLGCFRIPSFRWQPLVFFWGVPFGIGPTVKMWSNERKRPSKFSSLSNDKRSMNVAWMIQSTYQAALVTSVLCAKTCVKSPAQKGDASLSMLTFPCLLSVIRNTNRIISNYLHPVTPWGNVHRSQ